MYSLGDVMVHYLSREQIERLIVGETVKLNESVSICNSMDANKYCSFLLKFPIVFMVGLCVVVGVLAFVGLFSLLGV